MLRIAMGNPGALLVMFQSRDDLPHDWVGLIVPRSARTARVKAVEVLQRRLLRGLRSPRSRSTLTDLRDADRLATPETWTHIGSGSWLTSGGKE